MQYYEYRMTMGLTWTPSADKHGIPREDALHAVLNFHFRIEKFDEPRARSVGRPHLFIGETRDGTMLLGVMAVLGPPDGFVIVHLMEAQPKILKIAKNGGN